MINIEKDIANIRYDIFVDERLSGDAKIIAMTLNRGFKEDFITHWNELIFDWLVDPCLTGNERKNKTIAFQRRIDSAVKELIEYGYLVKLESRTKRTNLDIRQIRYVKDKRFITCEFESLQKIFFMNKRESENILNVYLFIAGNRYVKDNTKYNRKIGFMTLNYISSKLNMNLQSLKKYKKKLIEMEILYFSSRRVGKGKYFASACASPFAYSFWKDKELCEEFVEFENPSNGKSQQPVSDTYNQVFGQKYRFLTQNHKEYPDEDMKEIYEWVRWWNEEIINARTGSIKDHYGRISSRKPKDESPFKDYDFYKVSDEVDYLLSYPDEAFYPH